jgi:hypothetical protein
VARSRSGAASRPAARSAYLGLALAHLRPAEARERPGRLCRVAPADPGLCGRGRRGTLLAWTMPSQAPIGPPSASRIDGCGSHCKGPRLASRFSSGAIKVGQTSVFEFDGGNKEPSTRRALRFARSIASPDAPNHEDFATSTRTREVYLLLALVSTSGTRHLAQDARCGVAGYPPSRNGPERVYEPKNRISGEMDSSPLPHCLHSNRSCSVRRMMQ